MNQLPHTLVMIRPAAFGFNSQTASTNSFQQNHDHLRDQIQRDALHEFDAMAALLSAHDVDVRIFDDDLTVRKPDAVFPNNWISFHEDGKVVLYPMMAENRRIEKRLDIVHSLKRDFIVQEIVDFSVEENKNRFVEGTGSLVFDHPHRTAYACISPRTHKDLVVEICDKLQYMPITFGAYDASGKPIYHTNVMLSIGRKFVLICLDSIPAESDLDVLLNDFSDSGKKVVAISYAQMNAFCGNALEVQTKNGDSLIIISETAFQSLLPGQLNALSELAEILPVKIPVIEQYEGGSVRCMIAGVHLPKRKSI
jgi:hypothetical protein